MSIKFPPAPPRHRPQGAQRAPEDATVDEVESLDEPSLVLSMWNNLKEWLVPEAVEEEIPELDDHALDEWEDAFGGTLQPPAHVEDAPTTRIDPVGDFSAVLGQLAAASPGPLVSALQFTQEALAADAAWAETTQGDLKELKRILARLRTTAWDADEEQVCDEALEIVSRQLSAMRNARRFRNCALVSATAYLADIPE